MNIRKQRKKKLKHVVRYVSSKGPFRKNIRYYLDWCCKECYFGWGAGAKYKHNCSQSNYDGLLKKYWKEYDIYGDSNES